MLFGRSIAIDDNELAAAGTAAGSRSEFGQAEAEFIERLKQGDGEAFDTLVTRHSQEVFAMLVRITGDREEASDLVQETFLSAVRSISGFRGEAGLKTWLFRIAVNHARNRFRWWNRRGRGRSISTDETIGDSNETTGDMLESGLPTPEETAIHRERSKVVLGELSRLAEPYKEAIVLCDIEGLSYEEIASVLGINIGTVKSRIARGRENLRQRLRDI